MTEPVQIEGVGGSAVFSPDGRHRYRLDRWWDGAPSDDSRRVVFVMLNPSVAGAHDDDPTIRKCIGFAKRNGFNWLSVVNLFSLVATQTTDLAATDERITPFTDGFVTAAAADAKRVVLAWGAPPRSIEEQHRFRTIRTLAALCRPETTPAPPFYCLGKTSAGYPRHPSRLPYSTPLEEYR